MSYLKELWGARELFRNLVMREVSGQYKRTVLGRLWSLATPLASMAVYTFIFSFVFRLQPAEGDPSGLNVFAVWLLCGLLPWTFFANALNSGSGSLVSNSALITKVYFPRTVLPLAAAGSALTNWGFEMLVLLAALVFVGAQVWIWLPLVAILMVLLALFASGLGLMLSVANVYFRDIQHLLGIVLQVWMYLTPIVYPVSLVATQSDKVGPLLGTPFTIMDIYTLNPMYHFVLAFRQLLYDNRMPDTSTLIAVTLSALVALMLGLLVFSRSEKRIAEVL